jgi:uncharacterized protein
MALRSFQNPIDFIMITPSLECNLACHYCLRSAPSPKLSISDAKKAVDLLFVEGKNKKHLFFFGGEPLLCFELVRAVSDYAHERAARAGLSLTLELATNGTVASPRIVEFLTRYDFKVALSLNGRPSRHDARRVDKRGRGSFQRVRENFPSWFSLPRRNLYVSYSVEPKTVEHMPDDVAFLVENGFRFINLCTVYGAEWSSAELSQLKENFLKVVGYALGRIPRRDYIVLYNIGKYFKLHTGKEPFYECGDDQLWSCPLAFRLSVFPDASLMIHSFCFSDGLENKYSLGNLRRGFKTDYLGCKFSIDSVRCLACRKKIGAIDAGYKKAYLAACGNTKASWESQTAANSLLCDGPIGRRVAARLFEKSAADRRIREYVALSDDYCS